VALVLVDALITLGYAALAEAGWSDDGSPEANNISRRFALGGQVSLVLVRFTMAALMIEAVVLPLIEALPGVPPALIYMATLLPLALVVLVFGEVVPSVLGRAFAGRIAGALRGPMRLMAAVLAPLIWLVSGLSGLVTGLFGANASADTAVTEEQFLRLVENETMLEDDERKMIHSVMQLDETTVTEMMVPRIDIVAVDKTTSIAAARQVFLESGHSRMPVYEDNIDHIVGIVYVKDLLEVWHNGQTVVGSVEEIMRPPHFVPETMTGDQLLRFFQKNKVHLVIVMEDYGGTDGLVTLEDLLEEIVGDIQDEYDEDEHEEIIPTGDGSYLVDAGVSLYELNEQLELQLEDEEVDTLGGYIFKQLDRVPELAEVVRTDQVELSIQSLEGRRIREVTLRVLSDEEKGEVKETNEESVPETE